MHSALSTFIAKLFCFTAVSGFTNVLMLNFTIAVPASTCYCYLLFARSKCPNEDDKYGPCHVWNNVKSEIVLSFYNTDVAENLKMEMSGLLCPPQCPVTFGQLALPLNGNLAGC